jgi:hypothetical protein
MAADDRGVELRRLARERYSVDGMVEAHERLYHDAIGAAPVGGGDRLANTGSNF